MNHEDRCCLYWELPAGSKVSLSGAEFEMDRHCHSFKSDQFYIDREYAGQRFAELFSMPEMINGIYGSSRMMKAGMNSLATMCPDFPIFAPASAATLASSSLIAALAMAYL